MQLLLVGFNNMFKVAVLVAVAMGLAGAAQAKPGYVEPSMKIVGNEKSSPAVALTLDACSGGADQRIIDVLVRHRIAATIFVSGSWVRRNPKTMSLLKAHADLFEIENHGARHLPAIDRAGWQFGIRTAGSAAAVIAEVDGGARAIQAATGRKTKWFRGATAVYTPSSIKLIEAGGHRVAGYSISADAGALLGAAATERRILQARDGDVILAHVNHPAKPAGAGVVKGLLALKERGFRFLRLDEALTQ